jgi:uncharacterized protein (DUF1778 family)
MTRDIRIELRVTEQERERWQKAADREGWSLSEWIRRSLDKAADEQRKGRRR